MHRHLKRALSFALSAAMAASMLAVGASATEYTAPTTGVVANDNIITGTGNRAGTTTLSILGVNVSAVGDANGVIDGSGTSDEWGVDSPNLGTFGSDINDNPDPYFYNYFYNYNSTKSGGGTYSVDGYSSWNATPYTLIGQIGSTVTISIGGVTKTTSPYMFYEPDIHIWFGGGSTGNYETVLAAYQETYNEDYNPVFINTVTTNGARSDGMPHAYNMFEMSANMTDIGMAVDELAESLGKTSRYAESATEIGSNYDKWSRGFYYWAQLMFEVYDGTLTDDEVAALEAYGVDIDALGGGLEKVRGVRSFSYDSDTDSWTIATSSNRQGQYASGIIDDVYDVLTAEITAGTRDSYVLSTDELIEYLNPEGQNHAGVIVSAGSGGGTMGTVSIPDSAKETLEDAGIKIFANLPTTVYGITMQARENALGQPYYLAYFYYDQLSAMTGVDMTLNPISLVFYWMKNFYHVSDSDAMQQVIVNMLESADLPEGLVVSDSATTDAYGSDVETAIENMIILGMKYYLAVEEPALVAAGEEMTVSRDDTGATNSSGTNWAYWFSLNGEGYEDILGMGIGSDDIYLNPEGNGEANRYLNAKNYASDGTVETFYTEYSSYVTEGTVMELEAGSGDVNGDGEVSTVDAVIALRYATGTVELTSAQIAAVDISGDGEVKTNDAVLILQQVVSALS
ncbi:MAG: dockerin type I repeat-containing protein [Oscillospiraceae bacterium]|nr:dockerin type I repeat-containing protein [Oscillospiraceae bacterium]